MSLFDMTSEDKKDMTIKVGRLQLAGMAQVCALATDVLVSRGEDMPPIEAFLTAAGLLAMQETLTEATGMFGPADGKDAARRLADLDQKSAAVKEDLVKVLMLTGMRILAEKKGEADDDDE